MSDFIEGITKREMEIPFCPFIYIDKDGVGITKDRVSGAIHYFITLKFKPVNLYLFSEEEQIDFAEKLMEIINTLSDSYEVILYSETTHLSFNAFQTRYAEITRKLVLKYGENSQQVRFMEAQRKEWVEYMKRTRIITNYISIFYPIPKIKNIDNLSTYSSARTWLLRKADVLINKFNSVSVIAETEKGWEVLEHTWRLFHPKTSLTIDNVFRDKKATFGSVPVVVSSTRKFVEV